MNYKLIAYVQDFVSFLLQNLGEQNSKITQIILFGSVARGEAGKESDVDLFIDTPPEMESLISKTKEKFYESAKVKNYWSLLGVKNEINCTVGRLKEWNELERSIVANGITLFGKFQKDLSKKMYYLLIVEPSKDRNKNVVLWRALYGYKQKVGKKIYQKNGLVKEYSGKKLGPSVLLIPLEHAQKIVLFLKKKKIKHQILPIWQEE